MPESRSCSAIPGAPSCRYGAQARGLSGLLRHEQRRLLPRRTAMRGPPIAWVCASATVGSGTNRVTGARDRAGRLSVLAITGQVGRPMLGRDAFCGRRRPNDDAVTARLCSCACGDLATLPLRHCHRALGDPRSVLVACPRTFCRGGYPARGRIPRGAAQLRAVSPDARRFAASRLIAGARRRCW
jgi:hypothetical protein